MDLLLDCAALAVSRFQQKWAGHCVRNAVVLRVLYDGLSLRRFEHQLLIP